MNPPELILLPVLGLLIPIILVPTILVIRHERRKRDQEHAERMRALELGRSLPGNEPWFSPAKISVIIGGMVPIAVFAIACLASASVGYHEEIFISAGMVAATGVVSGSILAAMWFNHRATSESSATTSAASTKPEIDADAYDVTSARG